MLKRKVSPALAIVLLAVGAPISCKEGSPRSGFLRSGASQQGVESAEDPHPRKGGGISYEDIVGVANELGIIENHPSLYTYLEKSTGGDLLIIQETSGSRNTYKTITPIVEASSRAIYIDCSYVKSEDNLTREVRVGAYCRGQSEATRDSLEDAISEKHLVYYSKNYPWIAQAVSISGRCPAAMGIEFSGYHILRCDAGSSNELTEDISIEVFSRSLEPVVQLRGVEFAPSEADLADGVLVFWGLRDNSPHSIIRRVIKKMR
ncbi:hypothetical protein INQ40_10040 [Lysobacter sp. H21R4]|uniref:hypothetical protein n=1 Tax=Lysobacter sp. H21R4 TaxID=2781021 RepID=UPI001887422F|nr:hypothetical protein [Lysobacter sp. H21R4]QOY62255.1 hypothetical protein INQ40_10040 [Lysobacter sp. H21R4]